jgi:ATP-dependent helicase HepA
VEGALAVLRQHRDVVEKAIGRAKLELDAVALVVP